MAAWFPSFVFQNARSKALHRRRLRGLELGITGAVHAIAVGVAAIAFNWQSPGTDKHQTMPPPPTFRLHSLDTPLDQPKLGITPASWAPALAPTSAKTPAELLTPGPASLNNTPAIADEGGQNDDLAQDTLSWRHDIMARLQAQRSYPDVALHRGWQGAGTVQFRIERNGRLLDVAVAQSTGRPALDEAALGIVRRAAPFPPIPRGMADEMTLTLPIDFLIDHNSSVP
jgi:TonB family protein